MKMRLFLFQNGRNKRVMKTSLTYLLTFELNHIHDFSEMDKNYALKFDTMNKFKLFIKWMSTRMMDSKFELSAQYILALTYEEFNVFRRADMCRMGSTPTSPPPPLISYTPGSQTRKAFFPQLNDIFDEPDSESTETKFDLKKVDSSPS